MLTIVPPRTVPVCLTVMLIRMCARQCPSSPAVTLTSSFVLPAVQPGGQNNFTASLEVTDQTKSTYSCIEIIYGLDQ